MREITKGIKKFSSARSDTGTRGDTGTKRVKEDIMKHLAHCIFWVIHKQFFVVLVLRKITGFQYGMCKRQSQESPV